VNKRRSISPLKSTKQFAPATTAPVVESVRADQEPQRLIDKAELLKRVPFSFVTIWKWMREDKFPRSRNGGGKAVWVEAEIEAWINARPVNPLKPLSEKVSA
jgi:predicted DNA-binding transcriptional regulator AlpA